jgi:predicted DNA-binding transcriptional regulator AlpA
LRDIYLAHQRRKEDELKQRLWLDPAEVAELTGDDRQAIYRAIRLGQYPFTHVRIGRKIKISARSLGLIPEQGAENSEAREQGKTFAQTA